MTGPDGALPYPDPPLSDGRIGLRRWRESDIDCLRQAALDPRIPAGTSVPAVFTPAAAIAFVHRQDDRATTGQGVSQAIVETDTDRAIGLVWLGIRPQPRVAGLGYWLVPSARGMGAATAAVRLAVPWALGALSLRRLEAWVDPDNVASRRVLAAAGFEYEGRLRNFFSSDDGTSDALVFSVVG